MKNKTGMILNAAGAVACIVITIINLKFNICSWFGLPVEAGLSVLVLEGVFVVGFNYYLSRWTLDF